MVLLVQTLIGTVPLAPLKTLALDPSLPDWLPALTLSDLPVGDARVSLRFERDRSGRTHYEVLAKRGPLRVIRLAPPDDLETGPLGRLGQLLGALVPHPLQ
ncbi:hypothetical protein D3C72_1973120 [compost metagenome]